MPTIENENPETEEEEMEQDSPELNSSDDESDGEGSAAESSDIELVDEEECSRRRNECLDDMIELERQFSDIREQLYKERLNQIESKLEELHAGRAVEYLEPLRQLQEQMHVRTQVAGILRELRIKACQTKHESEELAANQHMRSEKMLLFDSIKSELEEKIRRLEEDRHNIDISSDLWNESQSQKKNKRKTDPFNPDRRRKPVTVTGPYLVYMLKDVDIIDDWTAIKKALKQQQQQQHLQKRRPEYKQTIQVR
ncbi:breast cancer metastasis-suppressor 1-like protein-A [Mercenaria mercenaria]|uniref:breast cancer metastasis-suppressor 1-like protein-A n=1 Tax=Mercenaria mercenaria TaxID=6596 RepID=UPI00234EEE3B|nr:breast cancer metastasis-suppressor 1-like protein-A [Mercenaria mercenaria]XP_053405863.1 breast cancer metastasis-suppressor 1-like protein-A [Mercenaria mercenaria]